MFILCRIFFLYIYCTYIYCVYIYIYFYNNQECTPDKGRALRNNVEKTAYKKIPIVHIVLPHTIIVVIITFDICMYVCMYGSYLSAVANGFCNSVSNSIEKV